jgi:hypothetical protein
MQFNVPLLPILIEVRWRNHRPPQVSLSGLMILVLLAGVYTWLSIKAARLRNAGSYYALQATESSGYGPGVESGYWEMSRQNYEQARDLQFFLNLLLMIAISVIVIGIVHCFRNRTHRRTFIPPQG